VLSDSPTGQAIASVKLDNLYVGERAEKSNVKGGVMAMAGASIGEEFRPGDKAPASGIYRVLHNSYHTAEHEVTCLFGETLPPCNHCGDGVTFILKHRAQHIDRNKHFIRSRAR
jgi:hypothetical protein